MKRIFGILLVLTLVLSFSIVATTPVAADPPQIFLWGVTGVNFGATNEYSQVFKVDTTTGAVTIVRAVEADPLYSDIAVTPNGNIYAIGRSTNDNVQAPNGWWAANFNDFYRLDPVTGAVIQAWENLFTDEGFERVNALAAESSSSLLAIEGGGVGIGWGYPTGPRLLRISLDDAGNFLNITSLGAIADSGAETCLSDGDLDRDPTTGKWYAGFWATAGSEMLELNLASPGSSTITSQSNIQWQGGFAFLSNGTAYAGSWADKNLYTVNVIGGGSAVAFDLSAYLAGNIFGLSRDYPTVSVAATTGTGTASFTTSHGVITDLVARAAPSLPSVSFPHGMFSFKIMGITPGQTVTLTIELPAPVPVGTVWWKYDNGRWYSLPNLNDNGNNIMVIQLTDGGAGDSDGLKDGVITDPGGPGNPMTVGWETSPTNKAALLVPWIILLAAIAAGAVLLVWRRRLAQI